MSLFARTSLVALLAVAGVAAAAGCSVPGEEDLATTDESALRALAADEILGAIASGETKGPVAHAGEPRYRAYRFTAAAGAGLDAWVRSNDGDAVAFLADASFKTIATNDDAHPGTTDAHVTATAPAAGTYYVVFRERDMEPATFTVSLAMGLDGGVSVGDAGVADATADATADAAPPAPGDACTVEHQIVRRPCGACGYQEALCLDRDGVPGGALQWSDYGMCAFEVPGGCIPGEVASEACGNCGTRTRTCTRFCAWSVGACGGEPVNSCTPGTTQTTVAGCMPGTVRERSCDASCTWSGFSATCSPVN